MGKRPKTYVGPIEFYTELILKSVKYGGFLFFPLKCL